MGWFQILSLTQVLPSLCSTTTKAVSVWKTHLPLSFINDKTCSYLLDDSDIKDKEIVIYKLQK